MDRIRIAVGSDERTHLTDFVVRELNKRGHDVILIGPLAGGKEEWAEVSIQVAERVVRGECDQGILFCWTGTGSSIAANKVPGIRAALCFDGETAKGARKWNHANILVMSLRLTSEAQAKEMLDTWFSTSWGTEDFDVRNVDLVKRIEGRVSRS